jgi:predicted transposase/invertase (TIGR01784 family)
MKFLKAERKEELSMLEKRNPQIKKGVGIRMKLSQDERTRLLYEAREKARRDMVSRMNGARREEKLENARNFLLLGVPVEIIAKTTGLSEDDVKKLQ